MLGDGAPRAPLGELRVEALLELLQSPAPAPGAGPVAGIVAGMAACLVAKAAASSLDWAEAQGARAQALALAHRAVALADADFEAHERALVALAARSSGRPGEDHDAELGHALTAAADAPLAIAAAGSDVAMLAAEVAVHGDAERRPDATSAAALAAAAVSAAAHLVDINLVTRDGDERRSRARELVTLAAEAMERALAATT